MVSNSKYNAEDTGALCLRLNPEKDTPTIKTIKDNKDINFGTPIVIFTCLRAIHRP